MADNVSVTEGAGKTIATDEIGGIQYQVVKLAVGANGVAADYISATNPVPVTIDTSQLGSLGQTTMSASAPVTIASDQTAINTKAKSGGSEYETVAASQTDQTLGATGATGDYLECLICVVATAATSQVQIKDGAGSAITVLPNAVGAGIGTYTVPLGLISAAGAWKVTTAAGVSVIASGDFT